MKKGISKKTAAVLAILQHLTAAGLAFVLVLIFVGQTTILPGARGNVSYDLYESDRTRAYEDSILFNNILGNNAATVARYVAIRSQIETAGSYDGEKQVDVTAYVNRGTTLPGDYITGIYSVANLLKWAQNGFDYETRVMTAEQSRRFLSDSTIYTRIINNAVSGGMNSYLNAQIEGNTETRIASPYEIDQEGFTGLEEYAFYNEPMIDTETEEHSVLINRYRTVDGYNIENIVSNWNDYQALCSNVVEAAQDMNNNYEEYQTLRDYYQEGNSCLRYFIVRSIGGRKEVYTNVEHLTNEANAEKIQEYFTGLTRHIYLCPYDLSYETDTLIKEETLRAIFKQYSYAYPDQIRIYLGVDLTADVQDDFIAGRESSAHYLPSISLMHLMVGLFAAAYLFLLILRIIFAGRAYGFKIDRMPTELILLLWLALLGGAAIAFYRFVIYNFDVLGQQSNYLQAGCAAAGSIVLDAILCLGLLTLIRKGKAARLWTDSGIRHLCLAIRASFLFTVQHTNLAVATWLPYLLLVIANLAAAYLLQLPGVIIAFIVDLVVGFVIYHIRMRRREILEGIERIRDGERGFQIDVTHLHGENRRLATSVNLIGEGIEKAVNTSMQDERLKTDLITNVSHDIKTPLTSIINYVDLLKREDIDNPKAQDYIRILDEKSQRLKRLTEDLVEASKISSGNIELTLTRLNYVEFIHQTIGEFYEKFEEKGLTPVFKPSEEPVYIMADPHYLWRVFENLFGNAAKYAMENTRIYMDLIPEEADENGIRTVAFSMRNVSKNEL
ncbi:MAG: HAMP domain-containing histidine kinase, partial [Lachnospiraceae bacterium]|nr:HAMP domain-containing histidine kinase [Lachnospiraceae bacterium]